ncbi:hypothetical protein HDV06_000702 [Boothiomyces sp. JEL0866]|nr:hypothetical protein HDV06_000702 [Boothiomyces sp. JEL0866]
MVVRIRLARWGARNNPFYGIVAANARAPRDGKHLERLGTYNPMRDENGHKHLELATDRIKYWLGVGAQPSDRAAWLLSKANLMPVLPRRLQDLGMLDLNDSDTWSVRLTDENGKELGIVTSEEARKYKQDTVVVLNKLDREKIHFGKKRDVVLSPEESLVAMKQYLGI